jgi:hypothetical protein
MRREFRNVGQTWIQIGHKIGAMYPLHCLMENYAVWLGQTECNQTRRSRGHA